MMLSQIIITKENLMFHTRQTLPRITSTTPQLLMGLTCMDQKKSLSMKNITGQSTLKTILVTFCTENTTKSSLLCNKCL